MIYLILIGIILILCLLVKIEENLCLIKKVMIQIQLNKFTK